MNLYFGNGDGTFRAPIFHWIGGSGQSGFGILLGDFNGDGKPDLLILRGGQFDIVLNRGAENLRRPLGTSP